MQTLIKGGIISQGIKRPPPASRKARTAEPVRSAQQWETRRNQYEAGGFCDEDAVAAAWGHQIGFSELGPPCARCTGLPAPSGPAVGPYALAWIGEPTAETAPTVRTVEKVDTRASCAGCDARWGALAAAHCSGCHQTFAGVSLFDRHRTGRGEHGGCRPLPDGLGELRDGVWHNPQRRPAGTVPGKVPA